MAIISEEKLNKIISEAISNNLPEYGGHSGHHHHSSHNDDYYNKVEFFNDPKLKSGKEWAKNGGNFAVKRNGKVYYVSRSVAVSLYCFCRDKNGEWCVLANQRGAGAPNSRFMWNVPCGYLDYNENVKQTAIRETYEETGVNVPENKLEMMGVNSNPVGGTQNVTIRFAAVLDGTTDNYPPSSAHCEPGEVNDIKWIPLSQVDNYNWAFGQKDKIPAQAKTSLRNIDFTPENVDDMVTELQGMLSGNPKALSLLNGILKQLSQNK